MWYTWKINDMLDAWVDISICKLPFVVSMLIHILHAEQTFSVRSLDFLF